MNRKERARRAERRQERGGCQPGGRFASLGEVRCKVQLMRHPSTGQGVENPRGEEQESQADCLKTSVPLSPDL